MEAVLGNILAVPVVPAPIHSPGRQVVAVDSTLTDNPGQKMHKQEALQYKPLHRNVAVAASYPFALVLEGALAEQQRDWISTHSDEIECLSQLHPASLLG